MWEWFRGKVKGAPGGRDRRKPANRQLRLQLETAQRQDAQRTLKGVQEQTAALDSRIENLRRIARVIDLGKPKEH